MKYLGAALLAVIAVLVGWVLTDERAPDWEAEL